MLTDISWDIENDRKGKCPCAGENNLAIEWSAIYCYATCGIASCTNKFNTCTFWRMILITLSLSWEVSYIDICGFQVASLILSYTEVSPSRGSSFDSQIPTSHNDLSVFIAYFSPFSSCLFNIDLVATKAPLAERKFQLETQTPTSYLYSLDIFWYSSLFLS